MDKIDLIRNSFIRAHNEKKYDCFLKNRSQKFIQNTYAYITEEKLTWFKSIKNITLSIFTETNNFDMEYLTGFSNEIKQIIINNEKINDRVKKIRITAIIVCLSPYLDISQFDRSEIEKTSKKTGISTKVILIDSHDGKTVFNEKNPIEQRVLNERMLFLFNELEKANFSEDKQMENFLIEFGHLFIMIYTVLLESFYFLEPPILVKQKKTQ